MQAPRHWLFTVCILNVNESRFPLRCFSSLWYLPNLGAFFQSDPLAKPRWWDTGAWHHSSQLWPWRDCARSSFKAQLSLYIMCSGSVWWPYLPYHDLIPNSQAYPTHARPNLQASHEPSVVTSNTSVTQEAHTFRSHYIKTMKDKTVCPPKSTSSIEMFFSEYYQDEPQGHRTEQPYTDSEFKNTTE